MRADSTTIAGNVSPPDVAVRGGRLSEAMRALRGLFLGPKYEAVIDDLQTALGVSRRTAERIYAGQSVGADTTLQVLTNETYGPALLAEILARLPSDRRFAVAEALRDAARLAAIAAEQEMLSQKIAEKRAGR